MSYFTQPAQVPVNLSKPRVSVIVPTHGRAKLLLRALHSVCAQTMEHLEIHVVMDGHDPETISALQGFKDPRLRWDTLVPKAGAAAARNRGIELSRAPWVAFLDDDDQWHPRKLELQLVAAEMSTALYPIVSTHLIVRSALGDSVWPRRVPTPSEPISEYLFCRRNPFRGDGQLQTSAILTARELMLQVPFDVTLRYHDDTDWYLRVAKHRDAEFVILPEALTVWNQDDGRPRLSTTGDWRFSAGWALRARALMTKRAYSSFMLSAVMAEAVACRDVKGVLVAFREALLRGRPSLRNIFLAFGLLVVPSGRRNRWRARWERRTQSTYLPCSATTAFGRESMPTTRR